MRTDPATANGPTWIIPATQTSTSIGPSSRSVRSTSASTAGASADIAAGRSDRAARRPELIGAAGQFVLGSGADHQLIPLVPELAGDQQPETAGGARHQGDRSQFIAWPADCGHVVILFRLTGSLVGGEFCVIDHPDLT